MSIIRWMPTSSIFRSQSPGTVITGSPGSGKALWNEEKILTPAGVKKVKDIIVGDYLFDKDGKQTIVLGVYPQGKKQLYKLTTQDGRVIHCSGEHLFNVVNEIKTVKEMYELHKQGIKQFIHNNGTVQYNTQAVTLHPYIVGCLLAAGVIYDNYICLATDNKTIIDKITNLLSVTAIQYDKDVWYFETNPDERLLSILQADLHDRTIPSNYQYNSYENRLALIKGLLDCGISDIRKCKLTNDTIDVFRGLGSVYAEYKNNTISVSCSKELSKELHCTIEDCSRQEIVSISLFNIEDCTCFLVDNKDHLFLAGDTVVTHNTFFILNILANCLGMGQRVIAIDPKNDLVKLQNVNTNIEIVDINKIRPGALNPFTFLDKFDTSTLLTIIEIICGKLDRDDIIEITPIIKDFVTKFMRDNEYKDMQDVADYLFSRDNAPAQKVGTMLKVYEDNKYGPLLFTREQNIKPLYLSNTGSMIISLHGMSLPDYTKKVEDYDANDRFTSAIVYILTSKLLEILSQGSRIPTILTCDESHLLFGNKNMSRIIDRFLVLGRSLNVATVLASQGISHFPAGIEQYITSKFMFKSSLSEAEKFINMFDVSKHDSSNAIDKASVISGITKLTLGNAFCIDSLGRSGFFHVTSNYDVKLLTSNPIEKDYADENNKR